MFLYDLLEQAVNSARYLDESIRALEELLSSGVAVWSDGTLYSVRQLVGRVNGLKVEIFSREHPPAHFHISSADVDATFSIVTGEYLQGKISGREKALVNWWYDRSRAILIAAWNGSRPSDCLIGPII